MSSKEPANDIERTILEILNRSPAVGFVWRAAPSWPVEFVTPNVAAVFGHGAEDFVEGTVSYASTVHPDDLERVGSEVATHSADTRCGAFSHRPYRIVCADGQIKWISDHTVIDRDADGAPVFYKGIITDITSQRRAEEELAKIEKLRSVGVLAGGIAHDFNNYLTGIMGNLSLLRMELEPEEGEAASVMLEEAEAAVHRARDLTQQLLTFSKGGAPIKRAARLDELTHAAAAFALRGSNARGHYDFPANLWPAEVDQGQLTQVVHNLVFNAVQAMPEGGDLRFSGRNVTLTDGEVPPLDAGDYIVLGIEDEGRGIAPEHLQRIFDPYFTTREGGTGLGLAVVFSIIEKHGGHVVVTSSVGAGTAFRLYLPAAAQANPTAEQRAVTTTMGSGRVLVMDDEHFVRSFVARMLPRLGYDVDTVEDGAAAIERYREALEDGAPFDVVILDLTVPGGMGGLEAMQHLHALDPAARVIVSSGYSHDPVMADFRAHGFAGALTKPYGATAASALLSKVLEAEPG